MFCVYNKDTEKVEDIHYRRHPNGYIICLGERPLGLTTGSSKWGWNALTYDDPRGSYAKGFKTRRHAAEHMLYELKIWDRWL